MALKQRSPDAPEPSGLRYPRRGWRRVFRAVASVWWLPVASYTIAVALILIQSGAAPSTTGLTRALLLGQQVLLEAPLPLALGGVMAILLSLVACGLAAHTDRVRERRTLADLRGKTSIHVTSSAGISPAAPSQLAANPLAPADSPEPGIVVPETADAPRLTVVATEKAPSVFVSHSSADNAFGLRLEADLKAAGFPAWYDSSGSPEQGYDEALLGGDDWWKRIEYELSHREVFVLILSPEALASRWVEEEIGIARLRKNRASGGEMVFVPVLHRPCKVPLSLARIQFVSFLPPRPHEEALAELVMAIRLGRTRYGEADDANRAELGPPFDDGELTSPARIVGRDVELTSIIQRLREGGVTALVGQPGVGKTALAAVTVRRLRAEEAFPDGIAVLRCNDLTDAAEVLQRVLGRFDPFRIRPEAPDIPGLADIARRLLQRRRALIVLDNVEPELRIEAVLAALRSAGATVLLTARQALPDAAVQLSDRYEVGLLPRENALNLFAISLGRTGVDALSPNELAQAGRIVDALGRHTLAVKLAGAYAGEQHLDLRELADQLENPDRALVLLPQDETPHAVALAFASSTEQLPRDARRLFAGLAAFGTREFGREPAARLGSALGLDDPEASTQVLVRRALVEAALDERIPEGSNRQRLRLHTLMRAYAQSEFDTWQEADSTSAFLAVAQYYATYAQERESAKYEGPLDFDEANITAALEWAQKRDLPDLVEGICFGMRNFWRAHWRIRDSLGYLPWGIEAARRLVAAGSQPREDSLALARLLLNYGQVLRRTGYLDDAHEYIQQSLDIRQQARQPHEEGIALALLGQIEQQRGHLVAADRYFQEALAIHRGFQDKSERNRRERGVVLNWLGQVARQRGQLEEAERHFSEALGISRERVHNIDHFTEGIALAGLGQIAQQRGWLDEAQQRFDDALETHLATPDPREQATDHLLIGQLALLRGRLDEAEVRLSEARRLYESMQDRASEGTTVSFLGRVALARSQFGEAEACFRNALSLHTVAHERREQGVDAANIGELTLLRGTYAEAAQALGEALAIFREVEDREREGTTLALLARLAEAEGRLTEAETLYRESLDICQQVHSCPGEADVLLALGSLLARSGDGARASMGPREEWCAMIGRAVALYTQMKLDEANKANRVARQLQCE